MEAAKTKLDTKLTQLKLAVEKTESVLGKANQEAIERHLNTLKVITGEVEQSKRAVEELKIEEKIEVTEIAQWSESIDTKIEVADTEVARMKAWLDGKMAEKETAEREGRMQFEMKLHQLKLDSEAVSTQKNKKNAGNATYIDAKLPKIEIARFDGSPLDWPRFWGQFIETVDKRSVAVVIKFAYLCGFLSPKVKTVIEGLPFTPEGYNRAKSILEERYGKNSEVIKAYVKLIMNLPAINEINVEKIHKFNDQLTHAVQALQTLKKLETVNGYVSMTLDKVQAIRGDLVRTDPNWEDWDFAQLSEALRLWTRRNPIVETNDNNKPKHDRPRKVLFSNDRERVRVYCQAGDHKTSSCTKVTDVNARREILAKKKLCFNCASGNHRAASCPSKRTCQNCNKRHHTSICDSTPKPDLMKMTTKSGSECVFPAVVVKVNGVKCRALIDSGAGSSYASAKLIETLRVKPTETKTSRIDMLMTSRLTRLEIYKVRIQSVDSDYELETNLTKVNKSELLFVDNPQYANLLEKYEHLKQVKMHETETKKPLPVHVVLGSGEYARVKTKEKGH